MLTNPGVSSMVDADESCFDLRCKRAPYHGVANSTLLTAIYETRFAGDLRRPSLSWVFRHARKAHNPGHVAPTPGKGRRLDTHRDCVDAWTTAVSDAGAHPRGSSYPTQIAFWAAFFGMRSFWRKSRLACRQRPRSFGERFKSRAASSEVCLRMRTSRRPPR